MNELLPQQLTELQSLQAQFQQQYQGRDFDLQELYPPTEQLSELYAQLTDLQLCLASFRPFTTNQIRTLQTAFDIEYTYHSNAIEGNTLTLMETEMVIHQGLTIGGKPLKDHLEAVNHQRAVDLIRSVIHREGDLTETVLLEIHATILEGIDRAHAGVYRQERVRIAGSRHICPSPLKVPQLMQHYFEHYEDQKNRLHPVELASLMHEQLVTIHPFIDGNGRTARLIMNLILLKHGYPITVISAERSQRLAYYQSLEQAQITDPPDNRCFQRLIATSVKEWLFHYLTLLADSTTTESRTKGYYFFKRLEPLLTV